ncbi:MAG TPA: GDSL-type esterase/lipase family protein [Nitriliruptoraceae bacterium]|nr:GDSL-type esterase/lipase family protein [Nitriliruptoraceae bacterium]
MARRVVIVVLSVLAVVAAGLPAAASAPTVSVPTAVASLGDSITTAFHGGCGFLTDCPANSWSTGSAVDSHVTRLEAMSGTAIRGDNLAVTGADASDMVTQAQGIAGDTGYVTMLIGANDACTDTVGQMTSVADFRDDIAAGLATVHGRAPEAAVFVSSIPDLQRLLDVGKVSGSARFVWWLYGICQSMLEDPLGTSQSDLDRRAAVRQRVMNYNAVLESECAAYAGTCVYDGGTVFAYPFQLSQLSTSDYFHPNVSGQQVLATATWDVTYDFGSAPPPNTPPTADAGGDQSVVAEDSGSASVTLDGSGSGDGDGDALSYAWAWSGGTAAGVSPTVSLPAGEYVVTLTVADGNGGSDSDVVVVSVAPYEPPPTGLEVHVGDLDATTTSQRGNKWDVQVAITIHDADDQPAAGVLVSGAWGGAANGGASCTTGADGTCTVAKGNLRSNKASMATFTVTNVSAPDADYLAGLNHDPDGDSNGTVITVDAP